MTGDSLETQEWVMPLPDRSTCHNIRVRVRGETVLVNVYGTLRFKFPIPYRARCECWIEETEDDETRLVFRYSQGRAAK